VQIRTCPSCVLRSIHLQLLLPFALLGASSLLFARLLPPPPYSTYREIVLSTLHYIFDRVPLVVLLDLGAGWWTGRVLRWRKTYLALSALILAYAAYVVFFSWFHAVGIWWLLPGSDTAGRGARKWCGSGRLRVGLGEGFCLAVICSLSRACALASVLFLAFPPFLRPHSLVQALCSNRLSTTAVG